MRHTGRGIEVGNTISLGSGKAAVYYSTGHRIRVRRRWTSYPFSVATCLPAVKLVCFQNFLIGVWQKGVPSLFSLSQRSGGVSETGRCGRCVFKAEPSGIRGCFQIGRRRGRLERYLTTWLIPRWPRGTFGLQAPRSPAPGFRSSEFDLRRQRPIRRSDMSQTILSSCPGSAQAHPL